MSNAPKKLKSNVFNFKQKLALPSWKEGYEVPVFSLPYPDSHVGDVNTYKLSPVTGMSLQHDPKNVQESLAATGNLILGLADASDQDMLQSDLTDFTTKYGFDLFGFGDDEGWFKLVQEWASECRKEGVETEGFPS